MIRALGAAMVSFGALWAGWRAVEELRGRVRAAGGGDRRSGASGRELWERGTALPELLEDLSGRTREPTSAVSQAPGPAGSWTVPLGDSWRRLTTELPELSPEGRAALLPWVRCWAAMRPTGSGRPLKRAEEALERERERAEKERDRMGRVYQTLSLAGGAFLVILLL